MLLKNPSFLSSLRPFWSRLFCETKLLSGPTLSCFLDIVLIARYPVFCVDCTVLGRKTWGNQAGQLPPIRLVDGEAGNEPNGKYVVQLDNYRNTENGRSHYRNTSNRVDKCHGVQVWEDTQFCQIKQVAIFNCISFI